VPATPVPCATRNAGRLAKLACGSDNASRLPPAFLRCSAPSKGPGEASTLKQWIFYFCFFPVDRESQKLG